MAGENLMKEAGTDSLDRKQMLKKIFVSQSLRMGSMGVNSVRVGCEEVGRRLNVIALMRGAQAEDESVGEGHNAVMRPTMQQLSVWAQDGGKQLHDDGELIAGKMRYGWWVKPVARFIKVFK